MSYDYIILRTTRAVSCMNDLSEGTFVTSSWIEDALEEVQSAYPDIVWSRESDNSFVGDGNALHLGRLDFTLSHSNGLTHLMVYGSHHSDQTEFVIQLSELLDASIFDVQTGQLLKLDKN